MSRMRVEPRRWIRGSRGSRTGAAHVRLTATFVVLVALAGGCAGDESGDAPTLPADPARALAQSAANLRRAGTFTFEASFTRVKVTAPDDIEEYATAKGALDFGARAGRAELDLAELFPGQGSPLGGPARLRWAGKSLTIVLETDEQTVSRARARAGSGLIGRYPDEVEALDDLLASPLRPRLLEQEDGTAHYAFAYDAKAAGRLGIPAELTAAFEQALYGPRLELEAWIEDDGLPHKLSYAIHLKPARAGFNLNLPARTVRVTYELDDFGGEFDPDG
jgi:hypothetical protein